MPFEKTKNYYKIRVRDPEQFEDFRIPDWAEIVANSVCKGAKVVTGKLKSSDDWAFQSVLIPRVKGRSKKDAVKSAREIVEKVEVSRSSRKFRNYKPKHRKKIPKNVVIV
mgnify:CR=1 FL=1